MSEAVIVKELKKQQCCSTITVTITTVSPVPRSAWSLSSVLIRTQVTRSAVSSTDSPPKSHALYGTRHSVRFEGPNMPSSSIWHVREAGICPS